MSMEEKTVAESGKPIAANEFTKDIARYFKVFLETDLQNGLLPTWRMSEQRLFDINQTLSLEKYPQLYKNLYKNVASGFTQETFVISQNKYVTHSDDRETDILARSTEAIDVEQIAAFVRSFAQVIERAKSEYPTTKDKYTGAVESALLDNIATELAVPMLRDARTSVTDNPAAGLALQKSAVYALKNAFWDDFGVLAARFYAENQSLETLHASLKDVFSVDTVKRTFREFLYEYTASDAYQDAYRIHRHKVVRGTDTQMYVFFGEISIQDQTFPLFYSPIESTHTYPSITVSFKDRIFINTKAIEYVLKQYGSMLDISPELTQSIEKSFTIDRRKRKNVLAQLQTVVDVLVDAFKLDKPLQLDSPSNQRITNGSVVITNQLRAVLFDASKEAIINDYTQLLANTKTGQMLTEFTQKLVMQDPVRYVQEISEEWDAKPITEKLISGNPLPLNSEQRKAHIALNKPDCDVVVINGAPGTGKSHFISSVVAQSFSDGFSTLVLSDTPAALDAVQDTVTTLLSDVRGEGAFHNPLLRLGGVDEEVLEDLESQFVQKIQTYHQNYTKLQGELRTAKSRKVQEAADELTNLTQNAENVNLHEVEQTVNNESKFGNRDWIQDEPVDEITAELQKLHQSIQYIRKSEANYLLPYIESSQQKAIAEFLGIVREYEKANKNVRERLPDFIVRYRKLLPDQKTKLQSSLSYIHSNYRQYIKSLGSDPITAGLGITENTTFRTAAGKQALLDKLVDVAHNTRQYLGHDKKRNESLITELLSYDTTPEEVIAAFGEYIDQVVSLKSKIFGFSGRTLVVENLTRQLKKSIPGFSLSEPEKRLDDMQLMVDLAGATIEQLAKLGLDLALWKEVLSIVKQDKAHTEELRKMLAALVAPSDFEFMTKHRIYEADNLLANISLLQYATELNTVFRANQNLSTLFGVKAIGQILAKPQAFSDRFGKLTNDLDDVKQLDECKKNIKQFLKIYPAAAKRLGVNYTNGNLDIIDDTFAESSVDEVKEYLSFKKKEQDITNYFKDMISDSYSRTKRDLRQINATQLSHALDTRLMKYIETQADNFAVARAALISEQQIDATTFGNLLQAFPCVLGNIRDYATYTPLKKRLFDVVIIDEASHISIAEALPALLRAKKIIILGDEKQYVCASRIHANPAVNETFRNRIVSTFTQVLGSAPVDAKNAHIAKVRDNFDVANSLLQFGKAFANAELTFTKYFRSSKELISYANTTFYDNKLQPLKARSSPPKETIKFDIVESTTVENQGIHTNEAEAKHILAALLDMKESGYEGTIGVVTPYLEQAVLVQKYLDESVVNDWFQRRKLRVMTFDTAQGENRDYLFYSMTADEHQKHIYAFPQANDMQSHGIAQQRLAVGFSCAGAVIHFVMSKPTSEYSGELKNVLTHYQQLLSAGVAKKTTNTTDILLAAESLIPQYFYATKFYKKYTDRARLITQFSLGDLLKPLSTRYHHPAYKVDFMIVFDDQRIIVTYDEFKENFMSTDKNAQDSYLTATEIYNQKELESYGYTFLRLNKFNLGSRPIETLDALLMSAVKTSSWPRDNGFLQ
jgi:hypothetical protein